MALGMEVGLGPGHIVLAGDPAPLPKGGRAPPQFSAHFYCGQTAGCINMPLDNEVGLSLGDFVLDGDSAPYPKKRRNPQFSAHVCCGQTAAWIMMPLGTEVGLSLRDIVLDGVLATPRKKGTPIPPNFWFMSIVVKRVDEDATWYGSSRRPRPHCIRRGPSCPRKGTAAPPPFLPMSFVATVAHVSYC